MNKSKEKIVNYLKNQEIIKKHIYPYSWLSGSSTTVAPITVWNTSVDVQLKTDRNYFKKFLEKVKVQFKDEIEYCGFWKTDGSCPSHLYFKLK